MQSKFRANAGGDLRRGSHFKDALLSIVFLTFASAWTAEALSDYPRRAACSPQDYLSAFIGETPPSLPNEKLVPLAPLGAKMPQARSDAPYLLRIVVEKTLWGLDPDGRTVDGPAHAALVKIVEILNGPPLPDKKVVAVIGYEDRCMTPLSIGETGVVAAAISDLGKSIILVPVLGK